MLRHVVLWTFPEDNSPTLNRENAIKIKAGIEELRYLLDGIVRLEVIIDPLPLDTCNADMMLDSEFASREDFEDYLADPRHLAVGKIVREAVEERLCMDYEFDA